MREGSRKTQVFQKRRLDLPWSQADGRPYLLYGRLDLPSDPSKGRLSWADFGLYSSFEINIFRAPSRVSRGPCTATRQIAPVANARSGPTKPRVTSVVSSSVENSSHSSPQLLSPTCRRICETTFPNATSLIAWVRARRDFFLLSLLSASFRLTWVPRSRL